MAKYKIIRDKLKLDLYDLEGTLGDVRNRINWLIDDYGEDAMIDFEYGYEGIEDVVVHFDRKETDKERNKRLKNARKEREKKAAAKIAKEKKERAELARLTKKYGEG